MTKSKTTKYSIKEISKAWIKFTNPQYLVDNKKIEEVDLTASGGVVEYSSGIGKLEIDYSRWILYLISEEWKKHDKK